MKKELFPMTDYDKMIYNTELSDYLPERMIDIHTHVYLNKFRAKKPEGIVRAVTWPSLVAEHSPIEELLETYKIMFPGKRVTPLIFSSIKRGDDADAQNDYIAQSAAANNVPALLYSFPEWNIETLHTKLEQGNFHGVKVYLNLSPSYIPEAEIRIFDFIPHHQLAYLNSHKKVLMLHIPRNGRLGDPVNLAQMIEIEERYPDIKVIYAHIGRAYCPEDFGDAFTILKKTKHLKFDFSATTQDEAIYRVLDCVGSDRVMFGSDLPILRMRMRRICEDGNYVNIVPKGMYGDLSQDSHMREVGVPESEKLTFFMYEELLACKRATKRFGATPDDIQRIFYRNAAKLLDIE
ncbi:hypothetical protein EXM22_14725 [Oceanispirochaeta crateris]|uniref:Amidohydrolase-related domain-containing protein n=1 Tax=Oceanispirochaeta crateris TaxID=2518645 RepID=A0A5C1QT29_9SPIO|nr:amidohydrolase family protein [Oceanispirochaeta crateris]QEN09172.1 hypothetical protein EXM22_14725 [Oceanispirochaeta crateris]